MNTICSMLRLLDAEEKKFEGTMSRRSWRGPRSPTSSASCSRLVAFSSNWLWSWIRVSLGKRVNPDAACSRSTDR